MRTLRFFLLIVIYISHLSPGFTKTNTSNKKIKSFKPVLKEDKRKVWEMMLGTWFGSQPTKDGGIRKEIMERFPDGTYKIRFRFYDNEGKFEDQIEVGDWGVSGGIYFSIFRGFLENDKFISSGVDPYNYDTYKIIKLTEKTFYYKSIATGNKYTLNRVPFNYKFEE